MLCKFAAGLDQEFLLDIFGSCSHFRISKFLTMVQFCCWWLLQCAKAGEVHGYAGLVLTYHAGSSRCFGRYMLLSPDCGFCLLLWSLVCSGLKAFQPKRINNPSASQIPGLCEGAAGANLVLEDV